ncbi:MAG: NAD(P)H-hydrate dehydratase, partial [Clostridia bacterium]|nr:NAD(P)H-hydrate dehydratase [Clostridia bacterium]
DGVFGTGFRGELPASVAELFQKIDTPVVAIDLPSGMDGNSGACSYGTMKPILTVTFAYQKPCHLFADCGRVVLADIGIPKAYGEGLHRSLLKPSLPPRNDWGHKNSYGAVGLLVGAEEYPGAAALALKGALNSGAGLVFGYLPEGPRAAAAAKFYGPVLKKETDLYPLGCNAYLAGSGLGRSEDAGERVKYLWRSGKPLVVDGDGLWHLQGFLSPRDGLTVLTPHMGEFARLLGVDVRAVAENRLESAERFAKKYQVILVLKDAATVVTNGEETAVLSAPCSALAKGGSGDLLAGLIAGLLAGEKDPFAAVQLGVWLHNRAAHLAAKAHSVRTLQPDQIADYLDDAWMELENERI